MEQNKKNYGSFRGRTLIQRKGSVGGYRDVFVKLQGIKNELIYPTFGGIIMNPFKGTAKMYAGDLCEYRTNDNGVRPSIYILKTFKVAKVATTTISIYRDGYKHIPFVGDSIMLAPSVIGGTGTAVRITNVVATTETIDSKAVDVWNVTVSAAISGLAKDNILVEAEDVETSKTSDTKAMIVKRINAIFDCDCDFFYEPASPMPNEADGDYEDARYLYTPALGGLMYINKMSPMPKCVLDANLANVNGWFKVDALFNLPAAVCAKLSVQ